MRKQELKQKTTEARSGTREAIITMYEALNKGQRKKIVKNEEVKRLFDLYDIEETQ